MPTATTAQLVDEYGRLDAELKPYTAKQSRKEDLAKLLRSSIGNVKPDQATTLYGDKYQVVVAPCAFETALAPMPRIYKALGKELFLKVCSMTLKALQSHAHPDVVARLTTKEQTGTRRLTCQVKQELAEAA